MKGSKRDNFNGGITLAYIYKNVIFRNQLNIGLNKGVESPYGSFSTYVKEMPYSKPFDENGNLVPDYVGTSLYYVNKPNPLCDAVLNSKDESKYTEIINNYSLEWKILEELTARVKFGISKKNIESDYFLPPNHSRFSSGVYTTEEGFFRKGIYNYKTGNEFNYEGNVTLSYAKKFNEKHSVYAGLDFSIQNTDSYLYDITVEGFTNENRDFFGSALQYAPSVPRGAESTSRRVGFTGNLNYTYDNRYYVDASYRVDGSSQFGNKNRFAPFWSVGAGWNMHNEAFLRDNEWISKLRLRASYGNTGSQNFSAYQALLTYRDIVNEKYLNRGGASLIAMGNERLKWQKTDQFNVGLELGLLDGRLDMAFDYYNKTTSNLLSRMDLPRSSGFASYIDNIGEVRNTGFEIGLNVYPIRNMSKGLVWMLSARVAHNKNEITKLSEAIKEQTAQYLEQNTDVSALFYEGYSQNSIWVVQSLGIDPSTGRELFLDKDGNMTTDWYANAKVFAGNNEPKYRGNLSSILRYKNFTLNLSFGYHWGGQAYNSTLIDKVEVTLDALLRRNVDRRVLTDRWSKPGDIAQYRKVDNTVTRGTTRFVMDDNVFQLQSASLQYRWDDAPLLKKMNMEAVVFAINMTDLFYLSSIKRERGTSYPFARTAGLSISLTF
jgi:TonB-linked SusC/RagA family outer membrane protein